MDYARHDTSHVLRVHDAILTYVGPSFIFTNSPKESVTASIVFSQRLDYHIPKSILLTSVARRSLRIYVSRSSGVHNWNKLIMYCTSAWMRRGMLKRVDHSNGLLGFIMWLCTLQILRGRSGAGRPWIRRCGGISWRTWLLRYIRSCLCVIFSRCVKFARNGISWLVSGGMLPILGTPAVPGTPGHGCPNQVHMSRLICSQESCLSTNSILCWFVYWEQ